MAETSLICITGTDAQRFCGCILAPLERHVGHTKEMNQNDLPASEIELKLEIKHHDVEPLWKWIIHSCTPRNNGNLEILRTCYFDTSDRRLQKRGLALRVREIAGRYWQSLKSLESGEGAIARREEWEQPVTAFEPALEKICDQEVRERIGLVLDEEVVGLFETSVERRQILAEQMLDSGDAALVEIALDSGEIIANGERWPVCEVELELKSGSPDALFILARTLSRQVPLRLSMTSKSDRGFRLLDRRPAGAKRASKPALAPDVSIREAVQRLFLRCSAHIVGNEPAVLDGRDIEGVHQMRVAARRARSLVVAFKPALGRDQAAMWSDGLRWLGDLLANARALDVLMSDMLEPVEEALPDEASLNELRAAATTARTLEQQRLHDALSSERYARLVLDFTCWAALCEWSKHAPTDPDQPYAPLASKVLQKRHERVRKLGRALEDGDPQARHKLRLALKKLRYASEALQPLCNTSRAERYIKRVARLQDTLGHMNDAATCADVVKGIRERTKIADNLALQRASGILEGWYAHMSRALEEDLAKAWRSYCDVQPFWHAGTCR